MMKLVIILIVLLLVSFAAYSQPIRGGRNPPSPLFLYFRLKKNQRQEGFINTYPWPKKPGIFYICVPLKGANAQDVAAFCVTARGRQNCLWESIARGPALINNRGAARG